MTLNWAAVLLLFLLLQATEGDNTTTNWQTTEKAAKPPCHTAISKNKTILMLHSSSDPS